MKSDNSSYEDGPGLRGKWAGNYDIVIVNTQNRGPEKTLKKAYNELYLPTFPLTEGHESLEKWKKYMAAPSLPIDYTITIAGNNLRSDTPEICGLCVSAYFKDSDTGYLSYIVVNPQHRTEGLGHALFRIHEEVILAAAVRNGKMLRGSFLDCDSPLKAPNSLSLIKKYEKWGGRQVPCTYRLPNIMKPEEKIYDWLLMSFPHPRTRQYPKSEAIIGALKSLYKNEGVIEPEKDKDYQAIAREIQANWNDLRLPPKSPLSYGPA